MTSNAQLLLYVLALVCFLLGLIDWPRLSTVRCISAGLMLVTLAQLVR